MTEAPELLGAHGVYVAYNLDQRLNRDKAHPIEALLIRLMLSVLGCSQISCGDFLISRIPELSQPTYAVALQVLSTGHLLKEEENSNKLSQLDLNELWLQNIHIQDMFCNDSDNNMIVSRTSSLQSLEADCGDGNEEENNDGVRATCSCCTKCW